MNIYSLWTRLIESEQSQWGAGKIQTDTGPAGRRVQIVCSLVVFAKPANNKSSLVKSVVSDGAIDSADLFRLQGALADLLHAIKCGHSGLMVQVSLWSTWS